MKKTMILAAFAALVSLASCQKEDVIDNKGTDKNASPVFTASIAGATKTTVDLSDGKVAWEADDEITITDASSASALYEIESIDATTGKATFAIKSGESALGDGPYTATYGTEPATVQFYSETAGKLYMTAPETSSNSFTFTVKCGLMKLNLTSPDESVKSIAVTSSTDATYTLTCDPAQRMDKKDFFIALPAGTYTKIEITNANDKTCTLNSTNGVEVAANHIKPVTLGEDKVKFEQDKPDKPDGKLPGKFTINDNGDQVYFSQGNLYYDGVDFRFEEHQYDFNNDWDDCYISHFYWSSSPVVATAEDYDYSGAYDGELFFTNEDETTADSEFTVFVGEDDEEKTGVWRTLSTEEWQYLFSYEDYGNDTRRGKCKWATVNGVGGYVIAPDDFEGTIAETYDNDAALATAGNLVFLPATGSRNGSSVSNVGGLGYYWSSAAMDRDFAYNVIFSDGYPFNPGNHSSRGGGYSVRLVTDVE